MEYLLAQVNIARMREPLDSPLLAGFVAALDPVNALADAAPGFVWRLQTEDGNATAVRAFEWDQAGSAGVLINMSVWESVETLAAFVYSDEHREVMKGAPHLVRADGRGPHRAVVDTARPHPHPPGGRGTGDPPAGVRAHGACVHAPGALPGAGRGRYYGARPHRQPGGMELPGLSVASHATR